MRKSIEYLLFLLLTGMLLCACQGKEEVFLNPYTEELEIEETVTEETIESDKAVTAPCSTVTQLVIHICGAVLYPGVYELPKGSRINDAVMAAGGMLEDAAVEYVNLAMLLEDGCKIVIPNKAALSNEEETSFDTVNEVMQSSYQTASQDRKVNINTADEAVLCTLTGIGATRAKSIIAYREENGAFSCIEDIMKVNGIKEGSFQKIKDSITIK